MTGLDGSKLEGLDRDEAKEARAGAGTGVEARSRGRLARGGRDLVDAGADPAGPRARAGTNPASRVDAGTGRAGDPTMHAAIHDRQLVRRQRIAARHGREGCGKRRQSRYSRGVVPGRRGGRLVLGRRRGDVARRAAAVARRLPRRVRPCSAAKRRRHALRVSARATLVADGVDALASYRDMGDRPDAQRPLLAL